VDDHGEETVPEAQGERYERSGRYGQESFVKRREREREKAKVNECPSRITRARARTNEKCERVDEKVYGKVRDKKNLAFNSRLWDMMCVCVCVFACYARDVRFFATRAICIYISCALVLLLLLLILHACYKL